jgi:tyrosyl-tRNA synthetase
MDEVATQKNMLRLSAAVETFFERASDYMGKRIPSPTALYPPPLVMNNIEWFKNLGVLEFMRVVGTTARVNSMIARERQVLSIQHFLYADARCPASSLG